MKKDAVSIKGTKNGLVILLNTNQKFEDIKLQLQKKMESSRGFFSGAKCTLYTEEQLIPGQRHELEKICREYGLIPDSGPTAPEIEVLFPSSPKGAPQPEKLPGEPALLINKTLRSGHSITHPTNVVVIGNVHPGAKIEAGGSIIITGNCMGSVFAGSQGDKTAQIAAFKLHPQVLKIANLIHNGPPSKLTKQGLQKAMIYNNQIIFFEDKN